MRRRRKIGELEREAGREGGGVAGVGWGRGVRMGERRGEVNIGGEVA